LASTTSADWTVTKLVFCWPFKIPFLGTHVHSADVLRVEGNSDRSSIWSLIPQWINFWIHE
jgi:hypothetical protein